MIYLLPTHPPIYLINYLPTYYPPTRPPFIYLPTYILTYIFQFGTTYIFIYPPTNILFTSLSTHLPT
jgi:hypothetical protein